MLYVSDFFTRHKEAVSNQIELLANYTSGTIVAATRFMKQGSFQKNELKDNIIIVPPLLYPFTLALVLFLSRSPVHTFEEESFGWKKNLFNISGRPLYVSLYRRPDKEHLGYIRQYRHLRKIFVELPLHREILIEQGFAADKIAVTNTPSKISRKKSRKLFNPDVVNIVFASWNNSEPNALYDRGILYLIDMLQKNPGFSLTIPLRDSKTDEFWKICKKKGVASRVRLIEISNPEELEKMFDESDFVALIAQKRVIKDVPNSLLDGLAYGKPVILSNSIDFWTTVQEQKIGFIIKSGEKAIKMDISKEEYGAMSNRAFEYSSQHTAIGYQKSGTDYEGIL